jgi:hypothetical protein
VGILKLYLLLWGLRLVLSGRTRRAFFAGGLVLAMPIVLKVVPALPVAVLLLVQLAAVLSRSPRRAAADARQQLAGAALGVGAGLVLFALLLPATLVGWNANLRHLNTWAGRVLSKADHVGRNRFSGNAHTVRNQSLNNGVYRLGNFVWHVLGDGPDDRLVEMPHPPAMAMDRLPVKRLLLGVRASLLLALLSAGVRLGRRGDCLDQAAGFALACGAVLVLSPISRGHYFMLLLPAVLLLPLWLKRREMTRAAIVMALVPAALSLLHYVLMPYTGRVGLLGLGTTFWLMTALVLVDRAAVEPLRVVVPEGHPRSTRAPVTARDRLTEPAPQRPAAA